MVIPMKELRQFVQLLQDDKIGIFPNDTIYGLIGLASSNKAKNRINTLKNRKPDTPLIVLAPTKESALTLVENLCSNHLNIIGAHWPGPHTFIFNKNPKTTANLTNHPTLAIRVPDYLPLTLLLQLTKTPIVATSVNASGQPPAATYDAIPDTFKQNVDFIASPTYPPTIGTPSSITDLTQTPFKKVR